MRTDTVQATNQSKVVAIAQEQREGRLSARWHPEELLLLIISISMVGTLAPAEVTQLNHDGMEARRAMIVDAVRLLVASPDAMTS